MLLVPGCQRAPVRPGCAQAAAVREDSAPSVPRPAHVPSGWKLHPPTLPSHGGPHGPLADRSWHVGARGPKGRPFRAVASVGSTRPLYCHYNLTTKAWTGDSVGSESNKDLGRATAARLLSPSQTLVLGSESNQRRRARNRCAPAVSESDACPYPPPNAARRTETFYGAGDVLNTPSPPRPTDMAVVPRPLT